MTIDGNCGIYSLTCDICGEDADRNAGGRIIMHNDTTIGIRCGMCKKGYTLRVNLSDLDRWNHKDGLAQDIFPYLSPDERELLISGICGTCFDKVSAEED